MDIKLRAKSWASILAIMAPVTLLGQLSRQTHYGSPVLFVSAIISFIIPLLHALQRTSRWQFPDGSV